MQSSTSLEELLSNGADSGEKNAMQEKSGGKGNVFIGGREGVLNASEPTLTRVDVHPSSSYNIFLDGVLVADGSCTHEPRDKDRNPWESMKPVTMQPTGPNCFCLGVGRFLNFGVPNVFYMVIINPFYQVLNCYPLCSQFIPQVPNVFPITLHFLSFL